MNLKKQEQETFENENMNKQTRIELEGNLNRILRKNNDQKNNVLTSSDSPSGSVKLPRNKTSLNSYTKNIFGLQYGYHLPF